MKLNNRLTIKQKMKLFFNLQGGEESVMFLVVSLIIVLPIFSKIDLKFQNGNIALLFFLLLLLMFPIIGFYLIYRNARELPRMFYALENGVCVEGELLKIKSTDTRINEKALREIRIGYELYGKKYICTEYVTIPVGMFKQHLLMVDADDPNNAVYLEKLPHDVKKELKRRNQFLK